MSNDRGARILSFPILTPISYILTSFPVSICTHHAAWRVLVKNPPFLFSVFFTITLSLFIITASNSRAHNARAN